MVVVVLFCLVLGNPSQQWAENSSRRDPLRHSFQQHTTCMVVWLRHPFRWKTEGSKPDL